MENCFLDLNLIINISILNKKKFNKIQQNSTKFNKIQQNSTNSTNLNFFKSYGMNIKLSIPVCHLKRCYTYKIKSI